MFKNLKSLFVKEGDLKKESEESEKDESLITNEASDTTIESAANSKVPANTDTRGQISEKFMDILLAAMKKNNREGFDYMEYKQSLQSLKKMEMDEQTRFKSAFAMAQTMGATKENITSSAQYYLDILQKEKDKFNLALVSQNSKQVLSKEETLKNTDKIIEQKEDQIQKLQEEIIALRKELEVSKKEIASAKGKVEKTKNDFLTTYEVLRKQIQGDASLINQYL